MQHSEPWENSVQFLHSSCGHIAAQSIEQDVRAEAVLGDSWKTKCLVVIVDDWRVQKPELYETMAVLGVRAAKLTVDLEPMFHFINGLLESGHHNVTFCWWNTDNAVAVGEVERTGDWPGFVGGAPGCGCTLPNRYIWLDTFSIPQQNTSQKTLAVISLNTYPVRPMLRSLSRMIRSTKT